MTDDSHHPDDVEGRSDDHQQAVEATQHAADALSNGDLARGRSLLDEVARAAEHDGTPTQEQREAAFDCYD